MKAARRAIRPSIHVLCAGLCSCGRSNWSRQDMRLGSVLWSSHNAAPSQQPHWLGPILEVSSPELKLEMAMDIGPFASEIARKKRRVGRSGGAKGIRTAGTNHLCQDQPRRRLLLNPTLGFEPAEPQPSAPIVPCSKSAPATACPLF